MIIPSKHSGYGEGGRLTSTRRVYDGGGGGGGTQTTISDLPDWAKPTAQNVLGFAEGAVFSKDAEGKVSGLKPYQTYGYERNAQFTPLQKQAYGTALGMDAGPTRLCGRTSASTCRRTSRTSLTGRSWRPLVPPRCLVSSSKLRPRRRVLSVVIGKASNAQSVSAVCARRCRTSKSAVSQSSYDRAADQFRSGITQQLAVGQQQNQLGTQQQQQVQSMLDQKYQDFLNQQKYPYQQIGYLSDILRGTPMGGTSTLYGGQGSTLGQIAGLGAGLSGLFRAAGGEVSSYAEGGVTDVDNVRSILGKLSDQQLQEAQKAAAARGDQEQMQLIAAEMAQRSSMRSGIAAALPDEFVDGMEEGMATGGIVAFAGGGDIERYQYGGATEFATEATPEQLAADEDRRRKIINAMTREDRLRRFNTENVDTALRGAAAPAAPAAPVAAKPPPAPVAKAEEKPAKKEEQKQPPKANKEVRAAIKEVAASAGVPEKTLTQEAMALYDQMQTLRKPELDKLNALIEEQKGRAEEIKGRGLSDALMNFGFTMAAEASKPGARFLSSASLAAPTISKTLAENQQAVAASQDAFRKAQIEQLRSQMTGSGENMRTSLTTAQNIMRDRLEQKKMAQDADYRNRYLAIQAAQAEGKTPALAQIAAEVMADPSFKGTKLDAMRVASGLMNGTEIRTDFNRQKLLADKIEKDRSLMLFDLQLSTAKTDAERAAIQAKINERKATIARDLNLSLGGTSPAASGTGLSPAELSQVQSDISKYLNPGK
jgi:hypothetical protein